MYFISAVRHNSVAHFGGPLAHGMVVAAVGHPPCDPCTKVLKHQKLTIQAATFWCNLVQMVQKNAKLAH
jgi:hypothetical protein